MKRFTRVLSMFLFLGAPFLMADGPATAQIAGLNTPPLANQLGSNAFPNIGAPLGSAGVGRANAASLGATGFPDIGLNANVSASAAGTGIAGVSNPALADPERFFEDNPARFGEALEEGRAIVPDISALGSGARNAAARGTVRFDNVRQKADPNLAEEKMNRADRKAARKEARAAKKEARAARKAQKAFEFNNMVGNNQFGADVHGVQGAETPMMMEGGNAALDTDMNLEMNVKGLRAQTGEVPMHKNFHAGVACMDSGAFMAMDENADFDNSGKGSFQVDEKGDAHFKGKMNFAGASCVAPTPMVTDENGKFIAVGGHHMMSKDVMMHEDFDADNQEEKADNREFDEDAKKADKDREKFAKKEDKDREKADREKFDEDAKKADKDREKFAKKEDKDREKADKEKFDEDFEGFGKIEDKEKEGKFFANAFGHEDKDDKDDDDDDERKDKDDDDDHEHEDKDDDDDDDDDDHDD